MRLLGKRELEMCNYSCYPFASFLIAFFLKTDLNIVFLNFDTNTLSTYNCIQTTNANKSNNTKRFFPVFPHFL